MARSLGSNPSGAKIPDTKYHELRKTGVDTEWKGYTLYTYLVKR
jgi:hypothetical protein